MNNNLHHLIPQSIRACLNLERIDIRIVVQGFAVQQRYPCVRVSVDSNTVFDDQVKDVCEIVYQSTAATGQHKCVIDLEYYNKTDQDTQVDSNNNIVANQSVLIKELYINHVDIIKTRAIHQGIGHYTMHLPDHKYRYFVDHGFNVEPTTNTHMFENGVWHIELDLPLLSTLTARHNFVEPWEKFNVDKLVQDIYNQLEKCKKLQDEQHRV